MLDQLQAELISEKEASQRLQSCDILPTLQRVQIARVLLAKDQHLSADQVLDKVNETGGRVSKATVYNTLGLFAKKQLINAVIVDPTRVFYDTNTSVHHHFYNIDTGELTDISNDAVSLNSLPALPKGTVTDGVDVIVRIRQEEFNT
ncbi:MAG: transcriptional repressor [Gammaproteobacteria bacterium]